MWVGCDCRSMNESLPPVEESTPHAANPFSPVQGRDAPLFDRPDGWERTFREWDDDVTFQLYGPGSLPAMACEWAERVVFTVEADKCRPSDGKRVYTVYAYPKDADGNVPEGEGGLISAPNFRVGNGDRRFRALVETLEEAANTVADPEPGEQLMLDGRRYEYED